MRPVVIQGVEDSRFKIYDLASARDQQLLAYPELRSCDPIEGCDLLFTA